MLTRKISEIQTMLRNPSSGFLSWSSNSRFDQREVGRCISIGRGSSQMITLDDPFVSRRHARVEKTPGPRGGEFYLTDMKSRNGTFLNGSRVFKALLKNNDHIKIGNTEFVFSFKRFKKNWNLFHQSLNPEWNKQLSQIRSMAQTPFPVLIFGPSGTGKEQLAQMLHSHSQRSLGPYVSVNCSALSETLAESEFFGHTKGSYTGAEGSRKGAFLTASGGTLFLDEIGDLPLSLQPKLLRSLECGEIKPVGSDKTQRVDVRVVSATHQNLQRKVLDGKFREDLYFRLRVLEVKPPSLKERMEDFSALLSAFSMEAGVCFSDKAEESLRQHSWPGNIRELKNTVFRAKALFPRRTVGKDEIKDIIDPLYSEAAGAGSLITPGEGVHPSSFSLIKQIEKEVILRALKENNGNQTKAAGHLGMARSTFINRVRYFGIESVENSFSGNQLS